MTSAGSPQIAIVVPCYDAERTLAETLESALAQRGVALEIVVIDDGSKDDSLAVARRFEPHVRVIAGPNRGASAARNTGIAAATAPWVVFLDADDLLAPDTLGERLERARETGADAIVTDWVEIVDDGHGAVAEGPRRCIDWPALERDAELAIASGAWATTAAILYARRIVERIGGFRADLPVIQDARFMFDAAHAGARFAHAGHIGAHYRVLAGSLSRRDPARFSLDQLVNATGIEELWRASGKFGEAYRQAALEMHHVAGRGLFRTAHPGYFDAVAAQRRLGLPLPLHTRIAPPLARLLGLERARDIMALMGR